MGKGKRVLIVEDESLTAMALSLYLRGMGYEVLGFSATGEEAVQRASVEHPDIVFMDVSLAGKMDGIEAAGLIAGGKRVSIIFMTGLSTQAITERVSVQSRAGYLVKPIDFSEINGILSGIV